MSGDSTTPVETVDVEDSLADFKKNFFNPTVVEEVAEEPEETPDVEDADAETVEEPTETEEVEDAGEDEGEDEEVQPEQKPHRNRKTAKERISELTAKVREVEAREAATIKALEARLAKLEKPEADTTAPVREEAAKPDYFPDEDAVDAKGDLIYPLGKFDPQYNADLVRATMRYEREETAKQEQARAEQTKAEQAQAALIDEWNGKLEAAEADVPDLREKIAELETTFSGLSPEHGIFLAENIMLLERGPEVLNYLADNISEAEAIVAASPGAALIKLGRIEGRLPSKQASESNKQKVSTAPPPPAATRGRGASTSRVSADTDNLGAFKREFFKP